MKKQFILAVVSVVAMLFAPLSTDACTSSCPSYHGVITVQQPEGATLDILIIGDMHFSYVTTADGYLLKENENGYYEYAKRENGITSSLGIIARNADLRSQEEISLLNTIGVANISGEEMSFARKASIRAYQRDGYQAAGGATGPVPTPVKKGLVVLVNYTDVKFRETNTLEKFNRLLNEKGYQDGERNGYQSIGSVKDYFEAASYGQYSPDFDVFGPLELPNDRKYYGEQVGSKNDQRSGQMVVDAYAVLADQIKSGKIQVNLADYDDNKDGVIDNIFVYYAGNNQAEGGGSDAIWPHKSELSGNSTVTGALTQLGYTIDKYACTSELSGAPGTSYAPSPMCGIGTFCHEFGHVLGLPDVYDTDYAGGHKTSGKWDIMDGGGYNGGGHVPPSYTAYERFFMGWVKPTVLNSPDEYTLENLNDSKDAAYIITYSGEHNLDGARPNPTIFYTLENRQLEGWDAHLPAAGMIITRIAYNAGTWSANDPNNDPNNMGIDIVEADGISQKVYGSNDKPGDVFPGPEEVTEFTSKSHPSIYTYENYPLTNIRMEDGAIKFTFMGGPQAFAVAFSDLEHGTVANDTIAETEPKAGIILPDVTIIDEEYVFEGWSTYKTAHEVNVGVAGDEYFPKANITLYAVYSKDGEIVVNSSCLIETFNKLEGEGTSDISREIDNLADNTGWTGTPLYTDNGAVKAGSDNKSGTITTPALNIIGNATVFLRAKVGKRADLNIAVVGAGNISKSSVAISTRYSDVELLLTGADIDTKLTFTAGVNEFYIDSVEICKTELTANETITEHNLMVVNNEFISGLEIDDEVKCFDMSGHALWTKHAEENIMYFDAPKGVYMITILRNGQILTIKNVNF